MDAKDIGLPSEAKANRHGTGTPLRAQVLEATQIRSARTLTTQSRSTSTYSFGDLACAAAIRAGCLTQLAGSIALGADVLTSPRGSRLCIIASVHR